MSDTTPQIEESYILIKFAAPAATLMQVQQVGVYPGQMILAGDYLLQLGRKYMEMQEQKQKQEEERSRLATPPKIIVPK